MYKILKEAHSGLAYLVLLGLLVSTVFYLIQFAGKKNLNPKSKTLALITMIVTHIQFLLGLILYFVTPMIKSGFKNFDMGDDILRFKMIEHPTMMLLAVIFVTIAHRQVKGKSLANLPLNLGAPLLFLLALLVALSRIPWSEWL